ncbi:hypothetical protein VTI74DRAFT_2748 [Chaetomium olivicolor]
MTAFGPGHSGTRGQSRCPAGANQHNPLKVLVVGDSISHGREGDWTWRYRIWQWFEEQRVPVRFVGPYKGTVPPEEPHPPYPPRLITEDPPPWPPPRTNGGYAAGVHPDFLANSDHFALSGQQAHQAKDLVAEQVAAYQPDLCLVQLGFNDLGWRVSGPRQLLADMKHLIDEARCAKPDLQFAVADVPHRTDLPGREDLPAKTDLYNSLLAAAIPRWSTQASPVALVRFCENYSCGGTSSAASYDGLHPNALGEYQLAYSFSLTLASPPFSLGAAPLSIPSRDQIPARPLPTPRDFTASPSPRGVLLAWSPVYGAFGYDVHHRVAGEPTWHLTHSPSHRWDWCRLPHGQVVQCRVRASGGDTAKSAWTEARSVAAGTRTAPPPRNIGTHATETGFGIAWEPVVEDGEGFAGEVERYGVAVFDGDAEGGGWVDVVGVKGTEAEFRGLRRGHRYFVSVETWTTVAGGGVPAAARAVRVGRGPPGPPVVVEVRVVDEHTVEVWWQRVGEAAGYEVWLRKWRLGGDGESGGAAERVKAAALVVSNGQGIDKATVSGIEPSVWDWEYAVSAYNGNDSSEKSEWMTAPEEVSLREGDSIHIDVRHG